MERNVFTTSEALSLSCGLSILLNDSHKVYYICNDEFTTGFPDLAAGVLYW